MKNNKHCILEYGGNKIFKHPNNVHYVHFGFSGQALTWRESNLQMAEMSHLGQDQRQVTMPAGTHPEAVEAGMWPHQTLPSRDH